MTDVSERETGKIYSLLRNSIQSKQLHTKYETVK